MDKTKLYTFCIFVCLQIFRLLSDLYLPVLSGIGPVLSGIGPMLSDIGPVLSGIDPVLSSITFMCLASFYCL